MSIFGSSSNKGENSTNSSSHRRKNSYNSGSESDGEREKSRRSASEDNQDGTLHDKRFNETRAKLTDRETHNHGTDDFMADNNDRNYGLSSGNSTNYSTDGNTSFFPRRGNGTSR